MKFTDAQLAVIDKVEKLLNLSAKAGTPAEAASAAAKAQELLAMHNLDTAALEDSISKQSAKREEGKVESGRYEFERDLWRAVAELNFCYYWARRRHTKWENCFIGRTVNVRATIALGEYLSKTIERITRQRVSDEGWLMASRWAHSYRRGIFYGVVNQLNSKRDETIEAEMKAAPGTHLTVVGYAKTELDANIDFRHGEGTAARLRDEAAIKVAMENAYTIWAAENPKAALSTFVYVDKNGRERQYVSDRSRGGPAPKPLDYTAFRLGHEEGKKISLSPQVDKTDNKRLTGTKDIYL